jgi:hypothetical protein
VNSKPGTGNESVKYTIDDLRFTGSLFPVHGFSMNKRAKKRLKETIAKDKQERAKSLPQQRPGSAKDLNNSVAFFPNPKKKRG